MNPLENTENKERKSAKKRWRWWYLPLSLLLGLLFSLIGGWYYLTSTKQGREYITFLGNKLTNDYLAHNATIGDVELQFPPRLLLSNVVIYDHKDSILFEAEAVRVTPVWPPLQDSTLHIDQLILSHFKGNLKHYEGDKDYNYAYAFKSSDSKNELKSPLKTIKVRKLIFEEGAFTHFDYTRPGFRKKGEKGIDFYRLKTYGVTGVLDSILIEDGVSAHLNGFGFRETSGFWLRSLNSDLTIDNTHFNWKNTILKSNSGEINGDILFDFEDWKSWKSFNDSIEITANLDESSIYFSDIAYFAPQVEKLAKNITIEGDVKGVLNDFSSNNLEIHLGQRSLLKGSGTLKNVVDPELAFIDFNIDRSDIFISDVNEQIQQFEFPKEFYKLGDMNLKGNFKGKIDSFFANGSLHSQLGKADAGMLVELFEDESKNKYAGDISLRKFNLGEFLENDDLGLVSVDADLKAKGNTLENLLANIDAVVTDFSFKNYMYHDVIVKGDVANYFFNGVLLSKDPNANLSVDGKIDFSDKIPVIDLITKIKELNLKKLNLSEDTIIVKTKAIAKFKGNKVENFIGKVETKNLFLSVNGENYETGFTTFEGKLSEKGKTWTLNADFANAEIETSIPLLKISDALIARGVDLIPKDIAFEDNIAPFYLKGFVKINDPLILNSVLPDEILLAQNTKLDVYIEDSLGNLSLNLQTPFFKYGEIYLDNPNLSITKVGDSLRANGALKQLTAKGFKLDNYHFKISNDSNNIYLSHYGLINDTLVDFELNHSIKYSSSLQTSITIDSSTIILDSNLFYVSCDTLLWQDLENFTFQNFNLSQGNERLLVNGKASLKNEYDLDYSVFGLNIEKVSPFLPAYFRTMEGEINANGKVISENGYPLIEASIYANPISFNDLALDAITIESHYNSENDVLGIYGSITDVNNKEIIKVNGGLNYLNNPSMDLFFYVNEVPNSFFEVLATGVVSDLKGNVSANARLKGPFENPTLNGWAKLDSTSMHVDYLGTEYSLNHTFQINSKNIVFENLVLVDHRGKTGVINGNIQHDLLERFDLNLDMSCTDFTVFDIEENENDLYYGKFYGTGTAKFTGPMLRANIYCDLATEKGTKFFLPIEEEQGYSQESFIRFVDKDKGPTEYLVNDQDFSLDLNVTLNTNAETQLIFDKQLGDIIKASGDGKLNMKLSPAGEFQMYGDYIIDNGNYLFTAFDLINKRFEIEKGGKISWVGDPYDALISIRANYNLKANAYSLASTIPQYDAERLEQYKTPVPVVAYAQLNGSLLKPEISLDFEFIDEGGVDVASLQRELDNMNLSEEELTKQVVSLLVLNRFMPMYNSAPVSTNLFGSSVNAGLGDLISNQLTYWLSAIDEDLQVNVNYRRYTAEGIELNQSELELALSTTFFNDRVGVDFAYELQNGYSPNKEISYKVNPDGSIKVLVFQRQTQNPVITFNSNTYGFGVFLKREFESVKDLFIKEDDPTK